ncbi:MAG: VCBS repeat-containing protein [Dechloromonas sp.]|nr:MAG: VCBS repeat-containing protein [Dechloromonas sp.]
MKIASANLQLASSHVSLQQHQVSESLNAWVGERRPGQAGNQSSGGQPALELVSLSEAGKAAQTSDAGSAEATAEIDGDPRLILIRQMLELWLGRAIKVFDGRDLQEQVAPTGNAGNAGNQAAAEQPPGEAPSAGFGVEYERRESYREIEQTRFSASGTVKTADGREIAFQLDLAMKRSYYEESSTSIRLGDAARKTDPLVLNFSGSAAQLTDQRFAFDLDNDGTAEQINFVAPGSGFLVFDRNQDGRINNGSELFGPSSNDGFAELAALDDDRNGWIDENDAAFAQLQIWSRDGTGQDQLRSLAASGVGAISLGNIATPFDLKNNANGLLGQIRSTGIFLQEDGAAGTIQQIDLTV